MLFARHAARGGGDGGIAARTAPSHVNARIPKPLDALVMKLLVRNREERYRDTHAVLADLAGLRGVF